MNEVVCVCVCVCVCINIFILSSLTFYLEYSWLTLLY